MGDKEGGNGGLGLGDGDGEVQGSKAEFMRVVVG